MKEIIRRLVASLCASGLIWGAIFATLSHAEARGENRMEEIDFTLDKQKVGKIVVQLSTPRIAVDIQKVAAGLRIDLLDTDTDDDNLYLLDVKDFSTQVSVIEVFRREGQVQIMASIEGQYSYEYFITGRLLNIVISPIVQRGGEGNKGFLATESKKMSINFQDIPVRNVLQLIAEESGFNLVVSDSVQGSLTLRLDDVPWPQVLDIILQIKGLDKRIDGQIVLIAPKTEFEQRERQALERALWQGELGELSSEIINVKFAKASDIASMVGGEGATSLLSPRGALSVDERTNVLLIRDLKENIDVIRNIVESLDVPVKQVQIEARIVTVNEGSLDELGVRWDLSATNGNSTIGSTFEGSLAQAEWLESDHFPVDDFLNVNLSLSPTTTSSIAFQVAKLGSDLLLDLELSALQRESKAEVISSPRLITTNKKSAYIEQGTEIPYLESSSSGATSVSFKKAVLSLKVTPQITPDNRLVLDLNVTQDRPGDVIKTGSGEAVAINTQRIGTQVLVDNGETIVLGGIFQHSVTDTVDKLPLLGDLPLLGALFRRSYQQMGKSELLIFVTPKVVIEQELAEVKK